EAADSRWRDVEPAIFGTLLERALDPNERHALGAHYTPRAYVERLVIPTLVEPLRDDWRSSQAVIVEQVNAGNAEAAIETARAFHRQLCSTRVLDPACGSQLSLRLTGAHEAPGRRSHRDPPRAWRYAAVARTHRPHRGPASTPWPRTQSPRSRRCRSRSLDRLSAMALPDSR